MPKTRDLDSQRVQPNAGLRHWQGIGTEVEAVVVDADAGRERLEQYEGTRHPAACYSGIFAA
ncbi:MAG: hypothetical protein ACR2IK_09995 [Chloroflexota bacterium]